MVLSIGDLPAACEPWSASSEEFKEKLVLAELPWTNNVNHAWHFIVLISWSLVFGCLLTFCGRVHSYCYHQ